MKRPGVSRFTILCAVMLILLLALNPFLAAGQNGQEPPVPPAAPVITGVTDGETYITPVTPAWEDAQGTTSEAALSKDGADAAPFENGTEIAENGSYLLTVTAIDIETGLTASVVVSFTVALEPPSGEDEQQEEQLDEELDEEQEEQLDEGQDEEIDEEQDEQQDGEENEEQDEQLLEEENPVSPDPPVIKGIEDGKFYNEPVAASWDIASELTSKATLVKDGLDPVPYSKGTLITESGDYLLRVRLTDTRTGLSASTSVRFFLRIETPVSDIRNLEVNRIKSLKAALNPNKRKLNTKLLQLVDESFLSPGETKERIKEQMISNKQIKLAGQASKSGKRTNEDMVYVYINFNKGVNTDIIDPYIYEIINRDEKNGLAAAWVETSKLENLASLHGVSSIHPVAPPVVKSGSKLSEGYGLHRVDSLWQNFGQGGAGVNIGVISDGVDNWTTAAGSGNLPLDLVVLSNSQGGDEGTAMLEIIHDLAPEAKLFFHDCGSNVLAFNEAIDNLVAAGCDIIVDDIGWVYEPFFDDGVIASHVKGIIESPDNEIIFVSSAGNTGKDSLTGEGDEIYSAHYQGIYHQYGATAWHDFSGGGSQYTELYAQIPPGEVLWTILQWDDPFENSVGNSTNDYDLYLFDVTDENDPQLLSYSTGYQLGAGYAPLEYIFYVNTKGYTIDVAVSVYKDPEAEERTLELYMYTLGSWTYIDPTNLNGGDSIFGHPAVEGVIAVGAINQSAPEQIADYSSRGPVTMRTGPARSKPDICGIDEVSVTGAGGFPSTFRGTSAAAPHVAAIAGLIKGYFTTASPAEIRSMIYDTAIDMGLVGHDYTFGYGKADALNIFEFYDDRPPGLLSGASGFEVTNLNQSIILNFDEKIEYTGGDPGELINRISVTDAVYNELDINSVNIIDGRQLRIDLTSQLSGANNKIIIEPGTLQDGSEVPNPNVLTEELTLEGIDEDTTPPTNNGVFVGYDYKKIFVAFNEKILDSTEPPDLKSRISCVVDAVYRDIEQVDINGNQLILSFAAPLVSPDVVINIDPSAIKDTNGNVADYEITVNSIDTAPPEFVNTSISNGNRTVKLHFNENIINHWNSGTLLKRAVKVSVNGQSFLALAEGDTVSIDGTDLVVNFSQALTGSNYRISLAANTIKDSSGNILVSTVITGIINPPPVYVGQAEVKNNNSRVSLLFSENIFSTGDGAALKAAVSYAPDGVTYDGEIVEVSTSGRYLQIDLSSPLEGGSNMFRISENAIKDADNIVLNEATEAGPVSRDESPPAYLNYDISGGYKTLTLHFDEELYRTGTAEQLKDAVSFAADGVNFGPLAGNDSVDTDGYSLVITFFAKLVGSSNSIRVAAGAIKDSNENSNNELEANGIVGANTEARLSALTISSTSLSPAFNSNTFAYTASVTNISSITVTPTCLHSGATVRVNGSTVASGQASGPIGLSIGENTITVLVTAEDAQTQQTYTITVTRLTSSGGGPSGGYYPPPVQPLRPLPPAPILSNTVTDDDKALEKSLQETGAAFLDLSGDSDAMATLSPGILTQLSAKNKPLLIDNSGIKLQFYPNSLITQEIRNSLTKSGSVVNIGAKPLDEQEKLRMIAQTPQGENTGIYSIGGEVFELTAEVVYTGPDGVSVKQKIEKFITPVSVTVNLAALRPGPEVAAQLSGMRLQKDEQGNIIPIPLGGVYNSQNYNFTFYTDKFSCYTVMLFKYRTALNMTIGSASGYVNGTIRTLDAPPTIINNRAMVPLRFIGEALGASFNWDEATRTVTFRVGLKEIKLVVGKLAPGLDSPPVIINNRTMVPVRYISEAFGAKVNWYPSSNMVTVFKE